MEIAVLNRGLNTLVFEVRNEGHTFCNVLKEALLQDPAVAFAAYRIDHPLISNPVFIVRTDGTESPEEALRKAAAKVVELTRIFEREALEKLK
ncbi:MAG: DNA-directed RNA polymerase subunit L [Candidatus Nezhaarchaeota archaeon]|nr:DNA-directed RNA polymerase subunit L [Candidatus Nezhaarchaeota archaeon]